MTSSPLLTYVLRQGDRSMVLAQRLLENVAHAPEIEEELALANVALDLLGQTRALYTYAGEIEASGHDEDHFAFWRSPADFLNPRLVEQPNGDFAHLIVRQLLHDAFSAAYWEAASRSIDQTIAELASKAVKECSYHLRHSRGWLVRLGDGTNESHDRAQAALDALWPFTDELFERDGVEDELVARGVAPDPAALRLLWTETVNAALEEATLAVPATQPAVTGGRRGEHGPELATLLTEMQVLARAHPGASW